MAKSGDIIDLSGTNEFASGFCGCFDDCKACVYGLFCACCMMLDIQKSLHEVPVCSPPGMLRQKIRHMRRIQGCACADCCLSTNCLAPFSMCQMYHELKVANIFDPCCCGC